MKLIILALFCGFICGCATNAPGRNYTVTGVGEGKNGPILVELYIEEDIITHIEVIKHNETPGFDQKMIILIDEVLASGSIQQDVISGATLTSNGLLDAIVDAYVKCDNLPINILPSTTNRVDTEILIIGGGGAGFVAAIEALSLGANQVTIIEKMPFGGGNTRMSGGEYAAPNNWVQSQNKAIIDSPDLLYQDMMKASNELANPKLVRLLCDSALPNALWLKDYVGVTFKDYQSYYGGHSAIRTLWPFGDGPRYIDTLIQKAVSLNATIHYNTKAVDFILDEQNGVIGVSAVNNDQVVDYYASKGVVLATGGFGANVDMRMFHDTQWGTLNKDIPTTNSPAIQGDGINMAKKINAHLIDMEHIQLYPINNPATGNYYFVDYARLISNALLLNKDGQRFVNEKETRNAISKAILAQDSTTIYELIDQRVLDELDIESTYENEILRGYDQGVIFKGTLEDCADFFDLPIEKLQNTIARYNQIALQNYDSDFNRTKDLRPLTEGPYMMFSSIVSVHYTMGGVEINEKAEVISDTGQIIKGLYAAGEVTGGIHGADRLGSMSIPDTVTFGRIAAQSIMD